MFLWIPSGYFFIFCVLQRALYTVWRRFQWASLVSSVKEAGRLVYNTHLFMATISPCGREVEYAQRFSACRMRCLKECPDGIASTAWDYAVLLPLLRNLYRDAGPKRCQHSQTLLHMVQHAADWVASFLRSQHSPLSPLKFFHTPPLLPSFRCPRVGAI